MIRSVEFPCDPRWIRNPTNSPLATIGQRMAAATRTKRAIAAVQAILSAHFRPPPLTQCAREDDPQVAYRGTAAGLLKPNRWTVRLTRISPGTLDPLTGGASMKAIQDAIARWCGVADERNPIWHWVEPIGQEKRGKGVYGVRIEIESLEPGEDRIVRLAGVEPRAPKGRRGRPTVGDLHAAAERVLGRPRASDGCHERPEIVQTLDQLGRGPDPVPSLRRCALDELARDRLLPKADVDAYEGEMRACGMRRGRDYDRVGDLLTTVEIAKELRAGLRDPGEEQAACMLKGCEACGVVAGVPCRVIGAEPLVFGVHESRGRAAGILLTLGDARRRAKAGTLVHLNEHPARGPRKLAAKASLEAFAVLPWGKPCPCVVCGVSGDRGCEATSQRHVERAPVRWPALDGAEPPRETWMTVPAARLESIPLCERCRGFGQSNTERPCRGCKGTGKQGRIRMVRREWTRGGKACWLYEPANERTGTR